MACPDEVSQPISRSSLCRHGFRGSEFCPESRCCRPTSADCSCWRGGRRAAGESSWRAAYL